MSWFAITFALRFVGVVAETLVVLLVPVGAVSMLLIGAVVTLAVLPDPMWIVQKLKAIGTRNSRD